MLGRVRGERPQLDPGEAGVIDGPPTVRAADAPRNPRALREGVGREAEAADRRDRRDDVVLGGPGVVDLVLDAEDQVVAAGRGDLFPDEEEHVSVPALEVPSLGRKRVVVGEQHGVDSGVARRLDYLRNARRPVGEGRVDVDDAGEVVVL